MNRTELENQIINQYPSLRKINLTNLKKEQLEQFSSGIVQVPVETLIKIFVERNEKASNNSRLGLRNKHLETKLEKVAKDFMDLSKSEVLQKFKSLFGKCTKQDNLALKEIGAVSEETYTDLKDKYVSDMKWADEAVSKTNRILKGFRDQQNGK